MFLKEHNKSAGVTLTELMVAVGIFGIISLIISTFMSQQQQTVKTLKQRMELHAIVRQVENAISKPAVIRISADNDHSQGGIWLANCLKSFKKANADNTVCNHTDPASPVPFNLIAPIHITSPTVVGLSPAEILAATVAGTDSSPALYQLLDGKRCLPTNTGIEACNVHVTAYWWATCPPPDTRGNLMVSPTDASGNIVCTPGPDGTVSVSACDPTSRGNPLPAATSCPAAQSVSMRFRVVYAPAHPAVGFWKADLPKYPTDAAWNTPGYGAITMNVADIPGNDDAIGCGANYTMTGVVDGVPTCECHLPFKQDPLCGDPSDSMTCGCFDTTAQCLPNERYRGTDTKGNIICCPVDCSHKPIVDWSPQAETETLYWHIGSPIWWIWIVNTDPVGSFWSASVAVTPTRGCDIGEWIESVSLVQPAIYTTAQDPSGNTVNAHNPVTAPNACVAQNNCAFGKWGGTCTSDVSCQEQYTCCKEYGGGGGACVHRPGPWP